MLHRLSLRVLPSLAVAVTEAEVRKRKRKVMLLPGFVAFGLYQGVKLVYPLDTIWTVLLFSGMFSAVTAAAAYRVGRQAALSMVWREDGAKRVAWVIGWVGFLYGVQLSLFVMALLRVLAGYDFLAHPSGPAMMAILIACTSVARDAFEIGHIRFLERSQRPVITFPDGKQFRTLVSEQPGSLGRWLAIGMASCAMVAWGTATLGEAGRGELGQLLAVTILGGAVVLVAHLAGQHREWWVRFYQTTWIELFRFWWWPGLVFAATYYLTLVGLCVYVLRVDPVGTGLMQGLLAASVGGWLAMSCYYLGLRRTVEDRVRAEVPESLLRCPFVMSMLSKGRAAAPATSPKESEVPSQGVAPDPSAPPR